MRHPHQGTLGAAALCPAPALRADGSQPALEATSPTSRHSVLTEESYQRGREGGPEDGEVGGGGLRSAWQDH